MAIICANGVIYFARKSISSKNFQGTLSYPKKKKKGIWATKFLFMFGKACLST